MDHLLHIISDLSPEDIIFYLSGFICHQDRTILISIQGQILPLCPRCLGLHTGFMIILLFPWVYVKKLVSTDKSGSLLIIVIIISLTGIHWLLGATEIIGSDAVSRFVSGLLSGAGLGILLKAIKYTYLHQKVKGIGGYQLIAVLLTLLLLLLFLSGYRVLLIAIMVMVVFNIISITGYLWLLINNTKALSGSSETPGRCNYEIK